MGTLTSDRLDRVFVRQREFMDMLREHDRLPEFPVDLSTKPGQRLIKETAFSMSGELHEALYELKNNVHRLTDARELDLAKFREELLGDTFAYFVELCILAGIGPDELYDEYARKNDLVKERLQRGY